MSFPKSLALLLTTFSASACGPGAADSAPIPADAARFDFQHGVILASPNSLGRALPGRWNCSEVCGPSFLHPSTLPPPFRGGISGTHGPSGDVDKGAISWSGVIPPDVADVVIPVLGGDQTMIEVKAGGRKFVAHGLKPEWRLWRIRVNPSSSPQRISVRAVDNGEGWGAWTAIGAPHLLRDQNSATGP